MPSSQKRIYVSLFNNAESIDSLNRSIDQSNGVIENMSTVAKDEFNYPVKKIKLEMDDDHLYDVSQVEAVEPALEQKILKKSLPDNIKSEMDDIKSGTNAIKSELWDAMRLWDTENTNTEEMHEYVEGREVKPHCKETETVIMKLECENVNTTSKYQSLIIIIIVTKYFKIQYN